MTPPPPPPTPTHTHTPWDIHHYLMTCISFSRRFHQYQDKHNGVNEVATHRPRFCFSGSDVTTRVSRILPVVSRTLYKQFYD